MKLNTESRNRSLSFYKGAETQKRKQSSQQIVVEQLNIHMGENES